MLSQIEIRVTPDVAANPDRLRVAASTASGTDVNRILRTDIIRRSIDARQRRVMVNLSLRLHIDSIDEEACKVEPIEYPDVSRSPHSVIIVGAGPAGLFAALELIELGIKPIILERGKDVDSRRRDMVAISREGTVNPDSNYCFGEGGAGAYSDGKLYTRSKKRGPVDKVLKIFHLHGAQREILVDAHPHIGTDRLPKVIKAMRETIIAAGGEVHFSTRVTMLGLNRDTGSVDGAICADGSRYNGPVILATGHSARDVYRMLHGLGIELQAKGIAVGVRLEHPQELIDSIQYHSPRRSEFLPAASYSLVSQENGRGVYSFCMCPGGFIVPAMTDAAQSVVNGMSPSGRTSPYANSGLVTEIRLADFEHLRADWGELAGLRFQQEFEELARLNGGDRQIAPAQRVTDFVSGRASTTLPRTSYIPGITPSRLDRWMPGFIAQSLRSGLRSFDRRMRGFVTADAIVAGVESRTSTPVRVPRDPETLMHPDVAGLFPSGEGAGYAGGIISAALDGERAAEAVVRYLA